MEKIDEPSGVVRMDIDPEDVQELADNISEVGLLQPIVVRPKGDRFEIVFGHRRFLAHRLLGRKRISCIVREMDDVQCAVARASENLVRVDISAIEEAAIYSDLRDNHGLTVGQISNRMGKSTGIVNRRLDLLKMPPQLQKAIHKKEISWGVGEELSRLNDIGVIDYYLGYAVDHGVTVAVARQWVNDHKKSERYKNSDVGGGGGPQSPMETKPTYIPCDLCNGPMEVGKETNIRACKKCTKSITDAMEG